MLNTSDLETQSADYELFGLDKNTCTLKDARLAYYNLALIVHPDRTHCVNQTHGANEMQRVTENYKKILVEIRRRVLATRLLNCTDTAQVHTEEVDGLLSRLGDLPSFGDIYEEVRGDIDTFNKIWDSRDTSEHDIHAMSDARGYELVESEYAHASLTEPLRYTTHTTLPHVLTELKKHGETFSSLVSQAQNPGSDIGMCDYEEAFGHPSLLKDKMPEATAAFYTHLPNVKQAYENAKKERIATKTCPTPV